MSSKFIFIAIVLLLEPTMTMAYWGWGGYRPYGFGMYPYYGGFYPYGGGVMRGMAAGARLGAGIGGLLGLVGKKK
uniref:Uncharacterized protein n=2 Tax=Parascaris TaxID=6254 RepID=A0A914RTC4_PAREQ